MIRYILLSLLLFPTMLTIGCGSGNPSGKTYEGGPLSINGSMSNCFTDSIYLYQIVGESSVKMASAKLERAEMGFTFNLNTNLKGRGFYSLGSNPRDAARVILGENETVTYTGDCMNAQNNSIEPLGSNEAYRTFSNRISQFNSRVQQLMQNIQMFSRTNPGMVPKLQQDLRAAQVDKAGYLDTLIQQGTYISKIAALFYFKPYDPADESTSKYGSEYAYFLNEFFTGIDVADPEYSRIPNFQGRFIEYGMNLGSQKSIPEDTVKMYLDRALSKVPANSENADLAYRGILGGLEQSKSDLFMAYAEKYLNDFSGDSPFKKNLQASIDRINKTKIGAIPPPIVMSDPTGNMLSLESLKGKYVMLDFWASWCRPCRAENPNVVRVYNKYKDAGFEILGVSLDKDKNKWIAAIQQDGLTWPHVSDLKSWSNQAAKDYGVGSIPMTFLLDNEGKIMAKGLRGKELESRLAEIFGF